MAPSAIFYLLSIHFLFKRNAFLKEKKVSVSLVIKYQIITEQIWKVDRTSEWVMFYKKDQWSESRQPLLQD